VPFVSPFPNLDKFDNNNNNNNTFEIFMSITKLICWALKFFILGRQFGAYD